MTPQIEGGGERDWPDTDEPFTSGLGSVDYGGQGPIMASTEFMSRMAELGATFLQRTALEAAQFDAMALAVIQKDCPDLRARIQYLAHRLAGGSAVFGLALLEEPASDLETRILANASAAEVAAGCRDLAEAIRRVCGAPASGPERDDGAA